MDRKKELRLKYKQMKPEMGVLIFECLPTGRVYIGCTKDTRSTINGLIFKLDAGGYVNHGLQQDWAQYGRANFYISVVDTLDYDKDESKTDYSEDLAVLRDEWKQKYKGAEEI